MKQFACGDVVPGCAAVMRGATEDEVLVQVAEHAKKDHGMQSVPAEVVELVRARIVDISAA